MNSVEDLSAFLPKYLSDANYRTLLKELDAEIREKNQRILELMCERDSDDGK